MPAFGRRVEGPAGRRAGRPRAPATGATGAGAYWRLRGPAGCPADAGEEA